MSIAFTKPPEPETEAPKEEQPYVAPEPKRRTGLWLAGIVVVWVGGWLLLRNQDTLVRGFQDLNGFDTWINSIRDAIQSASVDNWFFHGVLGGISSFFNSLLEQLQHLISQPAPPRPVPQIGWLGVVAIFTWIGYAAAGLRSAILVALSTFAFGVLGVWSFSMDTLIITAVAVVVSILLGLPLGIAMARRKWLSDTVTPILDLMQTLPPFAYLLPFAIFFSIGPFCAIMLTIVYAMPPLVRISEHGIRSVAAGTMEAAESLGVTSRQMLRQVQLPMARRTIVVGVNQCAMAALSMVTIAVFVAGPGLGIPVQAGLQNLDVGAAAVPSIAIVIMAIMLDRTTTAASERRERQIRSGRPPRHRRIALAVGGVVVLVCVYLSRFYLQFANFPVRLDYGNELAHWINVVTDNVVNAIDTITNGFKNAVSYGFLNPLQALLAETPWWLMALVVLAFAYVLGGLRPALVAAVCIAIILGIGLWNDSMVTLTMTLVATVLVMVVALVIGVWMGRSRRADGILRPFLDALQTLPPFVYLVPALALFASSRFTAIVAAFAYAIPVAAKLTADGIRGVSPTTVEAARSAGSTTWQMISKVQVPMARSALVLAANQGLLYVLSMVVIGGLVGGGSLGYIVVSGFSQDQLAGKGVAAGIAITALGIMLDRMAKYTAARHGRT